MDTEALIRKQKELEDMKEMHKNNPEGLKAIQLYEDFLVQTINTFNQFSEFLQK